jgi:hypothetical protein
MGLDISHSLLSNKNPSSNNTDVYIFRTRIDPTDSQEFLESERKLYTYAENNGYLNDYEYESCDWEETFNKIGKVYDEWMIYSISDVYVFIRKTTRQIKSGIGNKPSWVKGKGLKEFPPDRKISKKTEKLEFNFDDVCVEKIKCKCIYYNLNNVGYRRKGMIDKFYKIIPPDFFITSLDELMEISNLLSDSSCKETLAESININQWVEGKSFIRVSW